MHPTSHGFTSLSLAARAGSIAELPDVAPLADLVWLDVHGTPIERVDVGGARHLEAAVIAARRDAEHDLLRDAHVPVPPTAS